MRKGIVAAALLLAACANRGDMDPMAAQASASGNYAALPDGELCEAYSAVARCERGALCSTPAGATARLRTELDRRGLIGAAEWGQIDSGNVVSGMSYCGVVASWGAPIYSTQTGNISADAFDGNRYVGFQNGVAVTVTGPPL